MAAGDTLSQVDTRLVGKLGHFSGSNEQWADWAFKTTSWMGLLPVPDAVQGIGYDVIQVLDLSRDSQQVIQLATMNANLGGLASTIFNVLVQT